MTIRELRDKLSRFDGDLNVVALWENDNDLQFLEIDDISKQRGIPKRLDDSRAGFEFDSSGPAEWVFIRVCPA